jgi:hypothetical protein
MTTRRAARSVDMSVIFKVCVDAIMNDIHIVIDEKVSDMCTYGFKLGYEAAKKIFVITCLTNNDHRRKFALRQSVQ